MHSAFIEMLWFLHPIQSCSRRIDRPLPGRQAFFCNHPYFFQTVIEATTISRRLQNHSCNCRDRNIFGVRSCTQTSSVWNKNNHWPTRTQRWGALLGPKISGFWVAFRNLPKMDLFDFVNHSLCYLVC